MTDRIDINSLLVSVIFTILGITMPMLFHLLGLGSVFLPMYLPLAVGSFLMNRSYAAMAGFFTPLISSGITGMPPFYPPMAFIMMVQLSVFCLFISHFSNKGRNFYTALIPAILVDRIILAVINFFILPLFSLNPVLVTLHDLLKGFPGIILMIITVPLAVPQCRKIISLITYIPYEKSGD